MQASTVITKFHTAVHFCLVLAKLRYPQWLTGILGAIGGGSGVLFITVPDRFANPAFVDLVSLWSPTIWGVIFLIVGVALVTTSIVNPSSSGVLCVILGLSFFLFSFLTAKSAVEGSSTGLAALYALGLGFLCCVGMFASISPQLDELLRQKVSENNGTEG